VPSPIAVETLFARAAPRDYAIEEHVQYQHQWYCVVGGDVETVLDGTPVVLSAGQSVFIPPGMKRAPRCIGRAPHYVVAIFENRGLDLDAVSARRIDVPRELLPELRALVDELELPGGSDSAILVEALLVRLLVGVRRAGLGLARHGEGKREITRRVEAFLDANLHRHITRADVARAVHVSEPHLARCFRQATGATLGKTLTTLRIERAKFLLRGSTLTVTQVAGEVGFSSFSHFSKTFREHVGVVPTAFRTEAARARS
jgi:AraC-like DNA-binding protein